uniref:Uncharacterized protein n=1 Tax=Nelumbo nucifera TaxID=4432 RepID=A0A822XTU8_NELNU|nr:TPA_asm: hypothetical protein HUJ06_022331 [Nelumbo nucifera]
MRIYEEEEATLNLPLKPLVEEQRRKKLTDLRRKSVVVPTSFIVGRNRLPPDLRRSVFAATATDGDGRIILLQLIFDFGDKEEV